MSKLRDAVSKARLKRLGQDVVPLKPMVPTRADESATERAELRGRRRRRARGADDRLGSHKPANENGGQSAENENGDDSTQAASGEPEAIRDARKRLRGMINAVAKGAPKPSVGIVLAIVNQETGNHAAANALIDEYGLERLFGIKKFCPSS